MIKFDPNSHFHRILTQTLNITFKISYKHANLKVKSAGKVVSAFSEIWDFWSASGAPFGASLSNH